MLAVSETHFQWVFLMDFNGENKKVSKRPLKTLLNWLNSQIYLDGAFFQGYNRNIYHTKPLMFVVGLQKVYQYLRPPPLTNSIPLCPVLLFCMTFYLIWIPILFHFSHESSAFFPTNDVCIKLGDAMWELNIKSYFKMFDFDGTTTKQRYKQHMALGREHTSVEFLVAEVTKQCSAVHTNVLSSLYMLKLYCIFTQISNFIVNFIILWSQKTCCSKLLNLFHNKQKKKSNLTLTFNLQTYAHSIRWDNRCLCSSCHRKIILLHPFFYHSSTLSFNLVC